MKREKFSSRLGFILVSAGCAIGIGNVWKFPYMCGEYGGAAFILIYLLFLLIMGIPAMVCDFPLDAGSKKSVARHLNSWSQRHFLASDEIYRYFRLLSSDDVLHHGWRLDDILLFQKSKG